MISDITLIGQIKEHNDSAAVTELVNRHTGVYLQGINRYSNYADFRARANVDDLKDEKYFNIYSWALKYDPSHQMKFGTYVGEMCRFMCQNLLYRAPESVEFCEATAPTNEMSVIEQADRHAVVEEIDAEVEASESELFKKVFKARFGGQRPLGWRGVGRAVGLSHEGARKVYEKHIGSIRENLST